MKTTPPDPNALAVPVPEPPRKQWADLKAQVLTKIKQIDDATPWSEVEPDWWLQMMAIQHLLMKPV